jgi:hypothetical protein
VRNWCNARRLVEALGFPHFPPESGKARSEQGVSAMRKLVAAAALLSTAIATPALARDGSPYVGIDAGVIRPNSLNLRFTNSATAIDNALRLKHKWGYDADAVFGYDFGMFRLEGEVGYKRARVKNVNIKPAAYQGGPASDSDGRSQLRPPRQSLVGDAERAGRPGSAGPSERLGRRRHRRSAREISRRAHSHQERLLRRLPPSPL